MSVPFVPMDQLRRQCAGANHLSSDHPAGYWHRTEAGMYVCRFCRSQLPRVATTRVDFTRNTAVSCDGHLVGQCAMYTGGFHVQVVAGKGRPYHLVGDGVFALPTRAPFAVVIRNVGPDCFMLASMKVGSDEVRLSDHDVCLYHRNELTVASLVPGGKAFEFVSVTPGERARGEVAPNVAAGYNEDNILTLVLQRVRRITAAAPAAAPAANAAPPSRVGGVNADFLFNLDLLNIGRPEATVACEPPLTATLAYCRKMKRDAVDVANAWAGGTTVDVFVSTGEPVTMVLRLVCFQSDTEKEADNKRAELHRAGYDYWAQIVAEKTPLLASQQELAYHTAAELRTATQQLQQITRGEPVVTGPLYDVYDRVAQPDESHA